LHPQIAELSNGASTDGALPQLKWKSILLSEQEPPVAMIIFAHQICVKVRKTPSWPTSAFHSCIISPLYFRWNAWAKLHTCIIHVFWANLTPFSPKQILDPQLRGMRPEVLAAAAIVFSMRKLATAYFDEVVDTGKRNSKEPAFFHGDVPVSHAEVILGAWLEAEVGLGQPAAKRCVNQRRAPLQHAIELTRAVVCAEPAHFSQIF
jgi:hypothetical protein